MRKVLVKLSDKFDQEGKYNLADKADELLSTASRPIAPFRGLGDDVKKDLLKFVHNVKKNLEDSMDSLNEFFRRLRYFGKGDLVKDLKLDRALKEMSKTHECMDAAGKTMYALTYGKHPSKADLEQMAEDFVSKPKDVSDPLGFFKSQEEDGPEVKSESPEALEELDMMETSEENREAEPEDKAEWTEEIEEITLSDEEYEDFMRSMEEYEDFMEDESGSFEDEQMSR